MDEQTIERLREQAEHLAAIGDTAGVTRIVATLHPADLARWLAQVPDEQAVTIFKSLPPRVASEVLDETQGRVRAELVDRIDDQRLAALLDLLPEDDAADFLSGLPAEVADDLLGRMGAAQGDKVRRLLAYGREAAGRWMTTEVAVLRRHWRVAEALAYLRALPEPAATLYYLYVVDDAQRLVGVVPLRGLLLAQPDTPIEALMRTDMITVPPQADREQLAACIARYDYVAIPVVEEDGRLLGVVTVDDAIDVLTEEATEDIQRLGGAEPLATPYFTAPIARLATTRIVWLLPLFVASILTDAVIDSFTALLSQAVILAVFIPVVSGTGGNAGSQTVATIIRALATGDVRLADAGRAWARECAVAILLGLVLGVAGYLRAVWVGASPAIAVVLAITLPAVVILATSLATVVPLLALRLRIDPAVVSTPMIATLVDALGILIYLSVASAALAR